MKSNYFMVFYGTYEHEIESPTSRNVILTKRKIIVTQIPTSLSHIQISQSANNTMIKTRMLLVPKDKSNKKIFNVKKKKKIFKGFLSNSDSSYLPGGFLSNPLCYNSYTLGTVFYHSGHHTYIHHKTLLILKCDPVQACTTILA